MYASNRESLVPMRKERNTVALFGNLDSLDTFVLAIWLASLLYTAQETLTTRLQVPSTPHALQLHIHSIRPTRRMSRWAQQTKVEVFQ